MSEPQSGSINGSAELVNGKTLVSEEQNTLSIIANKVMGGDVVDLDKGQIDLLIQQREKVYDYIHIDKKQDSYDRKYYFTGVAIVVLAVLCMVVFKVPEYTTQVISLIIGAVGGYGLGKTKFSD